jgi:hypothetical protein
MPCCNSDNTRSLSPKKYRRKRIFVDAKLQGSVAVRVVLYWIACQLMTALLLFGCKAVTSREHLDEDMALFYRSAVASTLCILPLVVYDVLRLSHRFAGPMLRFRRAMRELGNGDHVEPLRFRDGDFWQELASDFNAVLKRVDRERNNALEDEQPSSEQCVVNSL